MRRWAIQAFGLTKHYGGRAVLRGLNLTVAPGEICGVAGEAGAGKSVLLRVLSTVTPADGGSFYVDGVPVLAWSRHRADLAAVRSRIGYVPPLPAQPEGLTGWESGLFFARHYRLDPGAARRRLGELFDQLNLHSIAHTPIGSYSAAQRTALAVAQALLHRPSVLLLDGPQGSADADPARLLTGLLRAEARRGTAVVLAFRTLGGAPWGEVCDHVHRLSGGTLRSGGGTRRP